MTLRTSQRSDFDFRPFDLFSIQISSNFSSAAICIGIFFQPPKAISVQWRIITSPDAATGEIIGVI